MDKSVLDARCFHDEAAAYQWVEARLWPNGPVCPRCGTLDRIGKLKGKSTRVGTYKCYECRKPFTVKVKTIFEASHVPMRHWLQALYLMCSSKKGVSSHQIQRLLGCDIKTAWFVTHRLREAMRSDNLSPFGEGGKVVEVDETLMGHQHGANWKTVRQAGQFRNIVLTLVERGGSARSFHISGTTVGQLVPVIRANIQREANLMTDQASWYKTIGKEFATHGTVDHSKYEYVRGQITTNTVEGYFSIFKRGMKGVYQHCSEKHLHRYLAEFDFRYSNRAKLGIDDVQRTEIALRGAVGKRLTYRTTAH